MRFWNLRAPRRQPNRPMIRVFAPAKINLALHVTGRRADGYHLLDMLVAFADVGDDLTIAPADTAQLHVLGPESAGLTGGANIITKVAQDFAARPYAITLHKNLPIASGIGGGSADAAAAFRGIAALQGGADAARLIQIGADVPMCLASQPARVRGIGEDILPLPQMARLHAVLVNPRVPLSTPSVFNALIQKENAPIADLPDRLDDPAVLLDWLAWQRNDLQAPAIGIAPQIGNALAALKGAVLARMSGSGASCFGIYNSAAAARAAADEIRRDHPDWWCAPTILGAPDITPQVIRATT